jgi:nucleoside 2-deoxyribosyltransferase
MSTYLVYLAGPISGLSYDDSVNWRDDFAKKVSPQIICLSPMRGKQYLKREKIIDGSYEDKVMSSSRGIITRDYNDCKRCDALIVNLLGSTKISIGTIMEIAWGKAFQKPIILINDDNNIYNHPMINECVGFKVPNLDEAARVLLTLLCP